MISLEDITGYLSWLDVEEVEKRLNELDEWKNRLKEIVLELNAVENRTPEKIESVLKNLPRYGRGSYLHEAIASDYLQRRKSLLDKRFEFTPKNVENLIRVNDILTANSQKVLAQVEKLHAELIAKSDDFTEDFEIDGTVRVSYNGNNSLIDFDPEKDEDEESRYPHIAELIDSITDNFRRDLFSCSFAKYHETLQSDHLFIREGEYWDYEFQRQPELKDIRFSWAFHNLVEHSLYALQDIVRINDFWTEVTVIYQNFDGDKSKDRFLSEIRKAAQSGFVLELIYQDKKGEEYFVEMAPAGFKEFENLWYLMGFSRENEVVIYALDRIKTWGRSWITFSLPPNMDCNRFVEKYFNIDNVL